jgi:glucose/arabinose dehydrogenase
MPRYVIVALVTAAMLILAACGNGDDDTDDAADIPTPAPTEADTDDTADPTAEPEQDPTPVATDDATDDATPEPEPEPTPTDEEPAEPAEPVDPELTTFIEGVAMPSSLAFTNDGRMFFNEVYDGRIRVVQDGALLDEPFAELQIAQSSGFTEHGLLGLALDPNFDENGYVYVFYTVGDGNADPVEQRIVRFTDQDNVGTDETVLVEGLPHGPRCCHNGGRIAFGPDGMLYATLGDVEDADLSQNPEHVAGSVLRYTPDGAVPDDNPFGPDNPVYAFGLRNPFGITFHPETGDLFVTENGPNGFDEVNRIEAGENYGWPNARGMAGDPDYVDPIWATGESGNVAPTGIVIPSGTNIPDIDGRVLFCQWNTAELISLDLADGNPDEVTGEDVLPVPCNLDVAQGPDGAIYASTTEAILRYGE